MRLESLIRRDTGTTVEMGGLAYHFRPRPDEGIAAHVEEVRENSHIQRFLSIPEGYRIFEQGADPVAAPALPKPAALQAANAGFEVDADGGLVIPDGEGDGPDPEIDTTAPDPDAAGALTAEAIEQMTEDELRVTYETLNGRAAPGNTKPETLREKLKELVE